MKRRAVICDIDGTLAHMQGRSPYDYSPGAVLTDAVDETIRQVLWDLKEDVAIILVSGRKSECLDDTNKWLADNKIEYDWLYMRASDDNRNDAIVKQEIYKKYIEPSYKVDFVLDDRNRVVKMWRELGLKCLQVQEGDF